MVGPSSTLLADSIPGLFSSPFLLTGGPKVKTELSRGAKVIAIGPVLDDLVVDDPEEVKVLECEGLSFGRHEPVNPAV